MLRCGSSQQSQRDVSHSDEFAACVCLQVSEALAVKGRVAAGSSGPYWSAEEGERRLSEVSEKAQRRHALQVEASKVREYSSRA